MKIMYLGIAVWPTWEHAKKITWLFMKNADLRGYPFKYYGSGPDGTGTPHFPGYRGQKVDVQLEWLLKPGFTEDYTHLLYTDCCDALLFGSPDEVEAKYKAVGSPTFMVAAADNLGNVSDNRYEGTFPLNGKHYGNPQCGGYICEIPAWIATMQRFLKDYPNCGDDCFMWYDSYKEGWWKPVLDTECEIFQVRDQENMEIVEYEGQKRYRNKITGSYPCIYHEAGGYFAHANAKDDSMIPLAKKVGIL